MQDSWPVVRAKCRAENTSVILWPERSIAEEDLLSESVRYLPSHEAIK